MQKRVLIIAGMHSSGTSLITQWLTKCGLQTGEQLATGNHGHAEGDFEDIEFLKMHEEILADHNLPTSGLTIEHIDNFTPYEKAKLQSIIRVKERLYDQWAWKDPRTCLFLNVYKELLPGACYLVILRDYQSVVSSLLRREFKRIDNKYMERKLAHRLVWTYLRKPKRISKFYKANAAEFLKIWITYNRDILACIEKLPTENFAVINYAMLKEHDKPVFDQLKNKWNFALSYSCFKDVFKAHLIGPDVNIEQYIEDKEMIEQANQLQSKLKSYLLR